MNSNIFKIVLSLTLVFMCTSCTTSHINKSGLDASVNISANIDLDANVNVGGRISGSAKESYFLFFKTSDTYIYLDNVSVYGDICSAAAYNAVSSSGADVIVNPQYVTSKESTLFTSHEECTVTGYKGTLWFDIKEYK
jgi:hypothetical protein